MKQIPLYKVFMPVEVDAEVIKTLHSGYLSEGERVKEFREKARNFLGTQYVVPMSSCTMALTISYVLAGVQAGDEVISTPLTCIATNTPIVQMGAHIVWADCDPKTGMVDPAKLEDLITPKTKAIVVLHKDGDLARMNEIIAIAKKHGVKVIEDAAHAFGASYEGKSVGTLGDYTCFSLQAIKHITTGDGGILTCKTEEDFLKAKKLKWLGLDKEVLPPGKNAWLNDIDVAGYKGNMNDLAATIGSVQMNYAKDVIGKFNKNGEIYNNLFKDVPGVELITRSEKDYATYWTYVVLVPNRDRIIAALATEGVASGVVHPRNDAYSVFKKFKRDLPGVDAFSARELSLPCGWWVEEEDIKNIVAIIKKNI
jgi:dTDP-4-amino-4,6-dideoxygalactose transaminase